MGSCVALNPKTLPKENIIIAVASKTQNRKNQQLIQPKEEIECAVQKEQPKQTTNPKKNRYVPILKPLNENKLYVNRVKNISNSMETLESMIAKPEQECVF